MTSQFPTLERLRPLLRIEFAAAVVLLLVAVVWFNLNSKVEDARAAETVVEQKLRAARADLNLFAENNEQSNLEEKLRLLQLQLDKVQQITVELSPRADALRVRDDILAYVDERNLALNAFAQEELKTPAGGEEIPTIRYSFTTQGDEESLVGILRLLQDYPTATVQALQFARLAEDLDNWEMSLELSVFYLGSGQGS